MFDVTTRRTSAVLLLAAAVAAPTLAMAPAQAQGTRAVQASGHCFGGGTWKLKAKHDAGHVVVEFDVDTNRAGQVWLVAASDNRIRIYLHHRATVAPSGSFTVRVVTANRVGIDVIRARAIKGTRSCAGSVRL